MRRCIWKQVMTHCNSLALLIVEPCFYYLAHNNLFLTVKYTNQSKFFLFTLYIIIIINKLERAKQAI